MRPFAIRTVLCSVWCLAVVADRPCPDSAVRPDRGGLVKFEAAEGVDVGDDVIWILAVGSDARPGETMTRTRGDALQMIGINTKTGAATAIGIPRDSWVSIPGYGSNRMNAALNFGGPQLIGQTVAQPGRRSSPTT